MERVEIQKTLELSQKFRKDNDSVIRVVSARSIMVLKRVAKTALAVNTGIDGNGVPTTVFREMDAEV